ncbi:hypothetical protein [Propylenella binzhouense]|uniref:Tripartite tricarboxylate transporter TctB family protein n=1 Tax=Propylenella binzhouense TaxID=2555902 RepID=A0A964WV12_9HYPH|nr:hypothetical protein [Propylenella binzhouense]MYZ49717.1 hypothetical protein [Propylenella binzhouense]
MTEATNRKKAIGADLIIPLAGAAYAVYYVWSVRDFPIEAQMSGMILAGMLLFLVLLYLVRIGVGLAAGRYGMGLGDFLGPKETRVSRGLFFVLVLASVYAIGHFGFTLTTFGFLALSFVVLGIRPVGRAILVAAIAALVGWLFFVVLLGTRFPMGPFEQLMQAVF